MQQMTDLLGAVLCGGRSTRMGMDKGLLEKDGQTWALFMAHKLDRWKIPVVFSINPHQQEDYAIKLILPSGQCVLDAVGLVGPLEGLFSVHHQFPYRDLLLLPCDMLDLDQTTIATLLNVYLEDRGDHDFYVFAEDHAERTYRQPFCGIYTATALQKPGIFIFNDKPKNLVCKAC